KEMGIWRDVHITATGPIALRYPAVLTRLNLPANDRALLTVRAELTNALDHRRQRSPHLSDQWQEHSHPRRRLQLRLAAAIFAGEATGGAQLRARPQPEHGAPGRQAGERPLLRPRRPDGHSRNAGLVLLRSMGKLAHLGQGKRAHCREFAARPDPPPGAPSLGNQLDVWQRLRASGADRETVPGYPRRVGMAESLH